MWSYINRLLRNYFGFTRLEARGFWAWTWILVFLLVLNFTLGYFDFMFVQLSKKEQDNFNVLLTSMKISKESASLEPNNATYQETETFEFDPNDASEEVLKRLGIPEKTAKSIINYRTKGGKFRKKEDLKKIYGFPMMLYEKLEPYIILPTPNLKDKSAIKKIKTIQPFDLNVADTTMLSQIRGIGAKSAQRIVDYRTKLGGFIHISQLEEIYYLKNNPDILEDLSKYAYIQQPNIQKIKINQITSDALQQHPYFKKIAKSIISYRDKAGKPFKDSTELKKIRAITPDLWDKIKNYVDFSL